MRKSAIRRFCSRLFLVVVFCATTCVLLAQAPATPETKPAVPEWAQPGSATHVQVAPPADFHRNSKNFDIPIGIFGGQSDVGSAVVAGSASYDSDTARYTINSAGYNVWYMRDEFRYLWKKMSGDVSLAADISFPDPKGYFDRKAVLIIRQDLDDDSKEAISALHGDGMIHLAQRPAKGARVKDMEYRIGGRGRPGGESPDSLVVVSAKRIGIEKRGDSFALFVSLEGEPMHQFGPPITLHSTDPFTWASASVRTCPTNPIPLCSQMSSSRTQQGGFAKSLLTIDILSGLMPFGVVRVPLAGVVPGAPYWDVRPALPRD